MPIAIPPRKGLKASSLAQRRPDLTIAEVSKLTGTERGHIIKALAQTHFGHDKPKSRAPGA